MGRPFDAASRRDHAEGLQRYAQQHAAVQTRSGLSDLQRQAESRRLLAPFTPAEQRRIAALLENGGLR